MPGSRRSPFTWPVCAVLWARCLDDAGGPSSGHRLGHGEALLESVPCRYAGLQTDGAQPFPSSLGFRSQPEFWSSAGGTWLDNNASR